jgi:3-oxoacyl-[acyl-carrier protein] reductase
MSDANLQDNVVIIGASSSIGFEISKKFIKCGFNVAGTYSAARVNIQSAIPLAFQLDLFCDQSIEKFAIDLKATEKKISVIIFLSGILPGKSLEEYDFHDVDKVIGINFCGQAKVLSRIIPMLSHDACILMFSSISARRGSFDPIYAASKGALLSFVKSMSSRLPPGVRINALAPGLIEGSSMYLDMDPAIQELHKARSHSNSLLSMRDLSEIVFDICQPKWSHLNGACIDLNGGAYV